MKLKLKLKLEQAPGSVRFGVWRSTPGVRDLGDIIFFVLGWQITFWFWERSTMKEMSDDMHAKLERLYDRQQERARK